MGLATAIAAAMAGIIGTAIEIGGEIAATVTGIGIDTIDRAVKGAYASTGAGVGMVIDIYKVDV
jgi:hypothetical protein